MKKSASPSNPVAWITCSPFWMTGCHSMAMCVAASTCYDEADYIRDYDAFLRYVGAKDAPAE